MIHYGTSASQVAARSLVFGTPLTYPDILPKSGPATDQPATPGQIEKIKERLREELDAGGLAVGMGIQYTPGATHSEVIDMFRVAAERGLPVYTHVRSSGRVEPGTSIASISEVIAAATVTGASLHIVHINSSCMADALECLSMIEGARARGLDVTTEAYPYIAGMTAINSAHFNPGWQQELGIGYGDLMLPETGERLTKERFDELHNSSTTRWVIVFSNTQEVVDKVIPNPLVMIASDGLIGHPRNAGTYSRVLAQYVREKGTISLMDALRKMSLMPAQMLERSTPAARQKGRLQEGADADIVVFDAATISDRSTFAKPMEPSVGVRYLLVGGTLVVDEGRIVPDVFPGRALLGRESARAWRSGEPASTWKQPPPVIKFADKRGGCTMAFHPGPSTKEVSASWAQGAHVSRDPEPLAPHTESQNLNSTPGRSMWPIRQFLLGRSCRWIPLPAMLASAPCALPSSDSS